MGGRVGRKTHGEWWEEEKAQKLAPLLKPEYNTKTE
jgi:hypothetical protein